MTRKTTVCPNLKWTMTSETINKDDRFEEVIRTYVCKYKGYTFNYWTRDYSEGATDDEPSYSEREESIYCSETGDLVAEDWGCCDVNVVDYVKGLTKKQHTKDIIISMLLRSDLIYRWKHGKFFEYHGRYDKCNRKQKLQILKKELNKLSLTELYKLMRLCNCNRVMKMCSGDRYTDEGLHYYQCFWLNEYNEVIGEFIDINEEYCRDVECDKHSTFYLLTHYNGMDF